MKKLATVLSIGMALAASSAFASDGTITINGQVSATTCTINGGGGGNNITVTLPKVAASALATANATAGRTRFQIALTGCTPTTGVSANTYFEPGTGSGQSSAGRLFNTGTATNVSLNLLDSSFNLINPNNNVSTPQTPLVPITGGAATLTYYAEYYAFGAATPGTVVATINYSINYQ